MLHWYLVGPFEAIDGRVQYLPRSEQPRMRAGDQIDPVVALRSILTSDGEFDQAVKVHHINVLYGGVTFEVDHLSRRAVELIGALTEKFGWIIIWHPFNPRVHSLADVQQYCDRCDLRRAEYRLRKSQQNDSRA